MGKVKAVDQSKRTEKNMKKAVEDVTSKKIGVNEASRLYEIPSRTLRRHILRSWRCKQSIGRPSELGHKNERQLVAHIKKLESIGFPLEQSRLQLYAYDFAEKLGLPHRFNKEKQKSQEKKLITVPPKRKKIFEGFSSSSESEEELKLSESSEECTDENEKTCVECLESYYHTKKKSDWIQCVQCSGWLHKDCTSHTEKCNKCCVKNKGKGKGKTTSK